MLIPSELKQYLKIMASHVRCRKTRWEAYREIRNHLLSKIEFLVSQGFSEEEALNIVLKEATSPKKLGNLMNQAKKPWYWQRPFLTLSIAAPLFSMLILASVSHILIQEYFLPHYKSQFQIQPEIADQFEADLKFILMNPLFPPSRELYNASAFFVHKVPLSSESITPKEIWRQRNEIMKIFRAQNWEKALSNLVQNDELMTMDLSWLEQMLDYDHWNIRVYEDKQRHYSFHLPIDDFLFLERVTIAYGIKKISTGDVNKGLKLIRHIARLLFTTQSYVGQESSLRLLRAEHVISHYFKLKDLHLVSLKSIDVYQRVMLGWAGIFQKYYFQREISQRWQSFMKKNVGVCPALNELSFNISFMSDFFGRQFPFEPSFQAVIDDSQKQREALLSECDLRGLLINQDTQNYKNSWNQKFSMWEVYLKTPHLRPEPYKTLTSWLPQLQNVPFIRRFVGFYLVSLNSNNSFEMYNTTSAHDF